MFGLMGEKEGMTQIFTESGAVPVTVMKFGRHVVLGVKTKAKDGYSAVVIGYGTKAEKNLAKPQASFFKKLKLEPTQLVKEFRISEEEESLFEVGQELSCDLLQKDDAIEVASVSKGRGFQGVMKRWNFGGGPDSHGCSVSHRVPGSIGQNTSPGKVFKGKKLPGHMGARQVTVKGLQLAGVEAEQGLFLVKGAVPGAKSGVVMVYPKDVNWKERLKSGDSPEGTEEKQEDAA
jgi:large subunit ribosomal protein L3